MSTLPAVAELTVYVTVTRYCLALWAIISSSEWMAARRVFADDGLVPWRLMKMRRGRFYRTGIAARIYAASTVDFVLALRFAGGVLLPFFDSPGGVLAAGAVIFACSVYISARAGVGTDGSDQMGLLIALGLMLMAFAQLADDPGVMFGAVLLLGGQGVLAYFISGASKFLSPVWRSGAAILGVMNTRVYGHDWAVSLVSRSSLAATAVCWVIICAEVLFPLVLVLPASAVYATLGAAGLFHLSIAYFMGLNTFVPTFVGTYPSLVILNSVVRQALFS